MIDDSPSDTTLARKALSVARVFCDLETAEHGREAQQKLQEGYRPHLILLDLNMPVMDGYQFLTWIKGHSDLKQIPVVVMTTSDRDVDVRSAWAAQCAAYIRKPVSLEGLADTFRRLDSFYFVVVRLPEA